MNGADIVSCIIQFPLQSVNYKPRNVTLKYWSENINFLLLLRWWRTGDDRRRTVIRSKYKPSILKHNIARSFLYTTPKCTGIFATWSVGCWEHSGGHKTRSDCFQNRRKSRGIAMHYCSKYSSSIHFSKLAVLQACCKAQHSNMLDLLFILSLFILTMYWHLICKKQIQQLYMYFVLTF